MQVTAPAAGQLAVPSPVGRNLKPASKVETAYHKADHAIQKVLDPMAA